MGYRIGSFNIRDFNFSNQASDGEQLNRDFKKIADIIRNENFDVIAIQEVNAEIAINHLTDVLNRSRDPIHHWDYRFSGQSATTINDPEGSGFIWNTKRLRLLDVPFKKNPDYYFYAGGKDVLRPPYYARFTARGMLGGSNFELRIVNAHFRFGNSEAERIKEFDVLVKKVLPRICDHQELSVHNEFMPAYTFLAGDYNLRLDKGPNASIRIDPIVCTNYTGKNRWFKTVQEDKTSLKQVNNVDDSSCVDDCYNSNFDHFSYEYSQINGLKISDAHRVEALGKYFASDKTPKDKLQDYREKVSDHVPISMDINLK